MALPGSLQDGAAEQGQSEGLSVPDGINPILRGGGDAGCGRAGESGRSPSRSLFFVALCLAVDHSPGPGTTDCGTGAPSGALSPQQPPSQQPHSQGMLGP